MKYSIIFAVIVCLAAILIKYLVDSRHAKKENVPEKEKTTEKLPVVADLPMKSKPTKAPPPSGLSTKATKSGTSTTKKATPHSSTSKTSPTHKTTQPD